MVVKSAGVHSVLYNYRLHNVLGRMRLGNATLKVLIGSNRRVSLAVCMVPRVAKRTGGEKWILNSLTANLMYLAGLKYIIVSLHLFT